MIFNYFMLYGKTYFVAKFKLSEFEYFKFTEFEFFLEISIQHIGATYGRFYI